MLQGYQDIPTLWASFLRGFMWYPITNRHSPLGTRSGLRQVTALSVPLVDEASYSKERSRLRRLSREKQTYLGASTLYVVLGQSAQSAYKLINYTVTYYNRLARSGTCRVDLVASSIPKESTRPFSGEPEEFTQGHLGSSLK